MNPGNEPAPAQMPAPAPRYADEAERLRVLDSYEPDALEDDPELAAIVRFASRLCDAPVSQVTLVEDLRQRFLAREGIVERETPREYSFCSHTLGTAGLMEVRDASQDPRFAENPLVTGWPEVRFYAGQPLVSEEGASLGTLCAIDLAARPAGLSDFQREGMAVLAQAVMRRLNARRAGRRASVAIAERDQRLRRMINGVPQIAWSADEAGRFDYFNRRWQQVTGGKPPVSTDDWREFLHPDDQQSANEQWQAALEHGREFAFEHRLRRADGGWLWVLSQAVPVSDDADGGHRWFGTITDIDALRRLSEAREVLSRELAHRIKNIFAVVIGLAMLKARAVPAHLPFAEELSDALRALDHAHDFVRVGDGAAQDNLHDLLAALFAPYRDGAGAARVRVSGVDFAVAGRAVTPLALVLHELATNAAKYGGLSCAGAHVSLRVAEQGDDVVLAWSEHGGPTVAVAGEIGFGSRLVEMAVANQLQGRWQRRFEPTGLVVELVLPKAVIAG